MTRLDVIGGDFPPPNYLLQQNSAQVDRRLLVLFPGVVEYMYDSNPFRLVIPLKGFYHNGP